MNPAAVSRREWLSQAVIPALRFSVRVSRGSRTSIERPICGEKPRSGKNSPRGFPMMTMTLRKARSLPGVHSSDFAAPEQGLCRTAFKRPPLHFRHWSSHSSWSLFRSQSLSEKVALYTGPWRLSISAGRTLSARRCTRKRVGILRHKKVGFHIVIERAPANPNNNSDALLESD